MSLRTIISQIKKLDSFDPIHLIDYTSKMVVLILCIRLGYANFDHGRATGA